MILGFVILEENNGFDFNDIYVYESNWGIGKSVNVLCCWCKSKCFCLICFDCNLVMYCLVICLG